MESTIHEILDTIPLRTVILRRIDLEIDVQELRDDPELVAFVTGLRGDTWPADELVRRLRTNPSFAGLTANMSPRETTQVFVKIKNWLIDQIFLEIGANHIPADYNIENSDLQCIEEHTAKAVAALLANERRARFMNAAPDTSAQSGPSPPQS